MPLFICKVLLTPGQKIVFLCLILLFLSLHPVIAEESAIFLSYIPPGPIGAGKTLIFNLKITNTGTENWVNGKYLVFVNIYNSDKEYLTQSDKIRQMVEIEPGEDLSVEISFEIPLNYAGIYYYTVNVDIEDKKVLQSRYFTFEIQPFSPEPKERPSSRGDFNLSYQASARSTPSSDFNFSLINRSPDGYSKVSLSGKDTGLKSSRINTFTVINNYLVGRGKDKLELLIGDTSSALSSLTLSKFRGLKAGLTSGKTSITGLVGVNQDVSSTSLPQQPEVYGVKISAGIKENLWVGMNFIGKIKNEATEPSSEVSSSGNSTFSLEMDFDLGSNFSLLGEYAWNVQDKDIFKKSNQAGDALEVKGSFNSEKIYIDGSYKKVGKNFIIPGNEELKKDYITWAVFLNYLLSDYLTTGFYYYNHSDHPSEEDERISITTKSIDLSFRSPHLPLISLSYDIDEMKGASGETVSFPIDDVTYTLHGAISYHFKNTRFSLGYLSSHYEDLTEPNFEDNFSLITYSISTRWWERFSLYVGENLEQKQVDEGENESIRAKSLVMTYILIPDILTFSPSWKVERKEEKENEPATTTRATLRYLVSPWNALECSYSVKNYGSFTNLDDLILEEMKISLRWRLELGGGHKLDVNYGYTGTEDFIQREISNSSSASFTYSYSF